MSPARSGSLGVAPSGIGLSVWLSIDGPTGELLP